MSQRTLTKRLELVKPGKLLVGIDLAREKNVAVMMNDKARQIERLRFDHTRAGYDYLYQRIERSRVEQESEGVVIGMEPTNYYWKLIAADLEKQHPEYAYRLVNPYTVRKHREGDQLDRSKDDRRDAFFIAELLRTGKFTETQLLHGDYAQLRHYGVLDNRLCGDISQVYNWLSNEVAQVFPELPQVFKNPAGETAQALLQRHAAAVSIRQHTLTEFIGRVRADFSGKRLALSKLREVYALAGRSVGLSEDWEACQMAIRMHLETLLQLRQQQAQVAEALVDTFLSLPEAPCLLSIPHIGTRSAALLLAEIGDPCRFSCAAQLIKLAGTQPVPNLSGRKTRSRTPMSHKGRARLRTTLYWIVIRLVNSEPYFQAEYQRLQTRPTHPLTKMEALGVLMNKLLRIVWALLHNLSLYESQQPRLT